MKPTILLAEDDARLAELIANYLGEHDYDVIIEIFGYNVARQVKALSPDLLLLDLGLPGKDGLDVCKEVREFYDAPILILTARNADSDQVLGLEFGADDYVVKPVEPRVLLARVRALLRRVKNEVESEKKQLEIGQLSINILAREVRYGEDMIELTSHEFDLLAVLVEKAGQVLSREFLFNKVYGRAYDGLDRTIDVRISQLRKKLSDNLESPEKIKTIWGRGYLLVADAWS